MGDTTLRWRWFLRRILYVLLAAIFALTAGTHPAVALATTSSVALDDDDDEDDVEPLEGDPSLPADLLSQIDQLNQQALALAEQAQALRGQEQSLQQRTAALQARNQAHQQRVASLQAKVDAHNSRPRVFQLPRQAAEARAYDAEAAQLNAEKAEVNAEAQAGEAESSQLRTEATQLKSQAEAGKAAVERLAAAAQQLRQRMAAAAQKAAQRAQAAEPAAKKAAGGDAARQASPRTTPKETGGDRPSRKSEVDALGRYAKERNAEVDRRPGTMQVDPDAVSRLPARQGAALNLNYTYQGRVLKPDNTYKVLQVVPPGSAPTAPQKALDAALSRGGKVTTDGGKTTITEVERIPGKPVTRRDITRQSQSDIDKKIREASGSNDPDKKAEADIARALRKCLIQFGDPLPSTGGTVPGEIDAGTDKTIVEVYNGDRELTDAKADQASKYINDPTANPAGRRVVYYVPNLKDPKYIESIKRFEQTYGVRVFTDAGKLRNYLRRTGERC